MLAALAAIPASTHGRATPADASQILPTTVRWSIDLSAAPASQPVVVGDRIVFAVRTGSVVAYGVLDGKPAWHADVKTDQPLAADDDRVFAVSADAIHALRCTDGSTLWTRPTSTLTAPLLAVGGWLIAASAGWLTAYNATDGKEVWRIEVPLQRERPSIEGDSLYVPFLDGSLRAFDLKTGTRRWTQHLGGPYGEVLALQDRLYAGSQDKKFYCISAATGIVLWQVPSGVITRGRPAADEKHVYFATLDNVVRAFDRRSGAMLWHADIRVRPTDGPTVIGTAVVVPGAASELVSWSATSGTRASQVPLGEPLAVPPRFGVSKSGTVMVAITGGLNEQWKLSLFGEPIPALPVTPLTELPGIRVTIRMPGG